jgi:putative flavoprotein involved in K+ transport
MRTNGTAEQVEVVVVGAGQAGLAVSYHLQAFGVEHVGLERDRIGESWRSARWDSFTLVTPNWMTRLPGYQMAAGTGGDFPPKDDVVAMLERLAGGLPVRERTEVTSVAAGSHGYQVTTATGTIAARAVVVAGGGQRRPVIPQVAAGLPGGAAADAARVVQHIAATDGGRMLAGATRSEIASHAPMEGAER